MATGGLGGNQNYFVNSYFVVGRDLNPFLEQSSHSVIHRRLEKPGGSYFYHTLEYESQFFLSKEDLNSSYSHFVQCILCKILS